MDKIAGLPDPSRALAPRGEGAGPSPRSFRLPVLFGRAKL
jgi:hypothetical protein